MATDFKCWSQANLANLAADQQAEIVRLNNQDCARLKMIRELCAEIDILTSMFCKDSVRIAVYRQAMDVLNGA